MQTHKPVGVIEVSVGGIEASDELAPAVSGAVVDRLHALDMLRGLCAVGVAIYHYRLWSGLNVPPMVEGFLTIAGTYGVSVFFILSGYSLAHAYETRFDVSVSRAHLLSYFRRRVARLAPLFLVAIALSIAGKIVSGGHIPDIFTLLASALLIFGFVDASNTPVIGGWSIGVEVVFYVFFPLMLLFRRQAVVILCISLFMTAWISWRLAGLPDLPSGWHLYVHPANQSIFFSGGVFLRLRREIWAGWPASVWMAIVLGVLVLGVAVAMGRGELELVTGWRRALLVAGALLMVAGIGAMRGSSGLSATATLLGGLSYPLYLMHPLLYFLVYRFMPAGVASLLILFGVALVAAVAVDKLADAPLQRWLKRAGW